jgi:hypothetical protein
MHSHCAVGYSTSMLGVCPDCYCLGVNGFRTQKLVACYAWGVCCSCLGWVLVILGWLVCAGSCFVLFCFVHAYGPAFQLCPALLVSGQYPVYKIAYDVFSMSLSLHSVPGRMFWYTVGSFIEGILGVACLL